MLYAVTSAFDWAGSEPLLVLFIQLDPSTGLRFMFERRTRVVPFPVFPDVKKM